MNRKKKKLLRASNSKDICAVPGKAPPYFSSAPASTEHTEKKNGGCNNNKDLFELISAVVHVGWAFGSKCSAPHKAKKKKDVAHA
ncbi:hypothetical protein OUZ56_000371 [Daphnia magna]|uniref:Uncharacterized protein n=1 Tax=Daphnia magna TaxID=35525 RepID=A0ABR0A048_9CRUS|nr:hypothetical protein OUZ56_000371 [Daphnia magna]